MNPFSNAQQQLARAAALIQLSPEVVNQLKQPKRVLEFSLPIQMDDGSVKVFTGNRVQYNDALGPHKGGIRFHPDNNLNETKALAFWMTIKTAIAGLPLGGGKGGVAVDPRTLSATELERLSRAWVRAVFAYIGPGKDVPAPDVYTNPQIMAWMVDEYSQLAGAWAPGAFTGKPIALGGSLGRETSTALGGVFVLTELLKQLKRNPKKTTVAVQGFGNVGYFAAEILADQGYKIVAVSDSKGGIFRPAGIDPRAAMKAKKATGDLAGNAKDVKRLSNKQLLELNVDVLIPAALENVITESNVGRVKARVILELANGPTVPKADDRLFKRKVVVVPDILANAGGVIGSYLEMVQNASGIQWTEKEFTDRLHPMMVDAFNNVWKTSQRLKVDLRQSAYALALERIAAAMALRRHAPKK